MNMVLFRTIKRKRVKEEKPIFINSFWYMFWEILFVSEDFEFLYKNLRRCLSKWKLRINRLCLLETPESRCWDEVRSGRGLLGIVLLKAEAAEAGLGRPSHRSQLRSDS